MKIARVFLLGFSLLVFAGLLLFGLFFLPSVQTWAARKVLASQPGLDASLGGIYVGLGHVRIEDLTLRQDGMLLTVPSIEAELSVPGLLFRRLEMRSLQSKGWSLKVNDEPSPSPSPVSPAATADATSSSFSFISVAKAEQGGSPLGASPLFQGLVSRFRLPFELRSLEQARLEGKVHLPAHAERPAFSSAVQIEASGIGVGRTGIVRVQSKGVLDKPRLVETLDLDARISLEMNEADTFSALQLDLKAEASGPGLEGLAQLGFHADLRVSGVDELYRFQTISNGRDVMAFRGAWERKSALIRGDWFMDLAASDLLPFVLGHPLPRFNMKGKGTLSLDTGSGGVALGGSVDANVDEMERLHPALKELGSLALQGAFDLERTGDTLRVSALRLSLAGGAPILELSADRSFALDLSTYKVVSEKSPLPMVRFKLHGVPLSWASMLNPALLVTGTPLRGEFILEPKGDGFSVRSIQPISIERLGLALDGETILADLSMGLIFGADFLPDGWQAELNKFTLSQKGRDLLELGARVGRLVGDAKPLLLQGTWSSDVPSVLRQPFFSGQQALLTGTASGSFQVSLADKSDAHLQLLLSKLVSKDKTQGELPDFSLELRAELDEKGRLLLEMPLQIENTGKSRRSDLQLSGSVETGHQPRLMDLKLNSRLLYPEDLAILAAPFATRSDEQPLRSADAMQGTSNGTPPWAPVSGLLQVSVLRLELDGGSCFENLTGRVELKPDGVILEKLRAEQMGGGKIQLDGVITHSAGETPYSLESKLVIESFDSSRMFARQGKVLEPVLEARFDVRGDVLSKGTDLTDLFSRATGRFELLSRGGICRLLRTDISDALQQKSATSSLLSTGLGALLGSKSAEKSTEKSKLDEYARMAAEAAAYFGAIPFDQLTVQVARNASLDIELKEFSMISPMLRLTGRGTISHTEGIALVNQPLDLHLQIAARGVMSDYLSKAGLLASEQDNLGYTAMSEELRLGGTLSAPDVSELKKRFVRMALMKTSDDLLQRLLGR